MRLDDLEHDPPRPLHSVGLGLTLPEAKELRDALESLIDSPVNAHEHVSSPDYQTEITVFIVDDQESY